MDFKKFWKETFWGFLLKRVLLAIIIFVALAWLALIAADFYTHHGESEVVPDLRGLYQEEAQAVLAKQGLFPKVIDSVYVRDKKLGTIIDQIPPASSTVKRNRAIYLIINSLQVRQVPLPDVSDISYRQADAMLKSIGLNVGSVEYTPSEYKDLVTDVKFRGRSVMPGTRIPEGSSLILVVGSGLGDSIAVVPSLSGMGLDEARQEVLISSFVIGAVNYDETPSGNESDYVIYRQSPAENTSLPAGSHIDIWLTTDKSLVNKKPEKTKKQDDSDEQFF